MPDQLDQFFRCVEADGQWTFDVAVVTWPHPHEPQLEWTTFRRWSTAPDEARLAKARAAALQQARFFRTCSRCGALRNAGQMHDPRTCQGCAEHFLGVVH